MGVKGKTISWQGIKQLNTRAIVKMINKYLPHNRLPIVLGQEVFGKYFPVVVSKYPRSSSPQREHMLKC